MIIGLNEIVKRVREQNLIEGLSERELHNPEGCGIDLRIKEIHKIVSGGAFIKADDGLDLGSRKGVETELISCYDPKKGASEQDEISLQPDEYYLIKTLEYLNIPSDLAVLGYGRGTLMKSGVLLIATKGDPGYEGHLVFGLKNFSQFPVSIQLGARIANVIFIKVDGETINYRGQHQGGRISISQEEKQV